MIRIEPVDTTELSRFALKWRWTDERYASLSEKELARIKPLRAERAEEIWQLAIRMIDKTQDFGVDSSVFDHIDRSPASEEVRPWLHARLPQGRVPVLVSWTNQWAVLTDSELFTDRWDDFCYPSSDNVTVFPLDQTWVLHYWHEEEFLYAQRRTTG
jgi:hypothetical protein